MGHPNVGNDATNATSSPGPAQSRASSLLDSFWLAAFFMIGVMIDYSEAFTDCIHFRKNREEYHALHKHSDIVGGALVRQQTRLRLVYICAGDFADKNNGAITALATVMVGLFTFTLWHTTRGLRRLGEGQAEDMRDLLKAARDNADAATGLRAAAEAQERALSAQAKATVAIAEMAEKAVRGIRSLRSPRKLATFPDSL